MNLFFLHLLPQLCAKLYCDRHMKISLEAVQMMYTALHIFFGDDKSWLEKMPKTVGGNSGYKPTHVNHPMTQWVAKSYAHFAYTAALALAICDEMSYRAVIRQREMEAELRVQKMVSQSLSDSESTSSSPRIKLPPKHSQSTMPRNALGVPVPRVRRHIIALLDACPVAFRERNEWENPPLCMPAEYRVNGGATMEDVVESYQRYVACDKEDWVLHRTGYKKVADYIIKYRNPLRRHPEYINEDGTYVEEGSLPADVAPVAV